MAVKRVKKEALITETILFVNSDKENEFESISPSFAMNHIDIISLDVSGDPVTPTTGSFDIFARTDIDGGFKRIDERTNYPANLTGGSGLADGVAVDAKFIGFPLEFKIVPNGVDVAVSYRVNIKQSSNQLGRSTPLETSDRGGVAVPVFVQDQTTQSLDLLFTQDTDTSTLDGDTVKDIRFFDVAAGDGTKFTANDIIEIGSGSTFIQARVKAVVVDNIELFSPMNSVYLDGTTVVIKNDNLRVDGSVTPEIFEISPELNQIGDITRIILRMEGTASMDSGTFGPLVALTNGVVLRRKKPDGDFNNLLNFKTNGDFLAHCFDHNFLPNNGQGIRLFVARLSYGGQERHGVVQRLDGTLLEELQIVIQDDLTDITFTNFTIIAQGHEVQP